MANLIIVIDVEVRGVETVVGVGAQDVCGKCARIVGEEELYCSGNELH